MVAYLIGVAGSLVLVLVGVAVGGGDRNTAITFITLWALVSVAFGAVWLMASS